MYNSMVKVAVVGCGHLGSYHAEKYSKIKEVELVGLCDPDRDKTKKLGKKYKCQEFQDYRELLNLDLDCVSIAADTRVHFEIAKFFLENGIDVLVEKPLTTSLEEAEILAELARTKERVLQVGHIERFNPAITKLKDHLEQPWFFEVRRIAPFKGRGADVDVILDLMIHDIDLLLFLVGRPITRIQAVGIPVLTGSVDIANARIEFEGGVIANISTSRAALQSERSFRIFQPNSYISLDLDAKKLKVSTRGEGRSVFGLPSIEQKEERINSADALQDQINAFVHCVLSRSQPMVGADDAIKAIKLIEAIKKEMKISAEKFGELPEELLKAVAS